MASEDIASGEATTKDQQKAETEADTQDCMINSCGKASATCPWINTVNSGELRPSVFRMPPQIDCNSTTVAVFEPFIGMVDVSRKNLDISGSVRLGFKSLGYGGL